MSQIAAPKQEAQAAGKRLKRVAVKRPPEPAFSPTLLFATIGAVVLVVAVIAGAAALHKTPPDAATKPAAGATTKDAPPPAPKDAGSR